MVHYLSLPELKKALGENYSIRTIDLEKCLYRDFGNGFNVEISGCSRANRKCPATLYLWFGDRAPDCIIVKTVRDVGRSAEAIGEAVEKLYACSEQLLANGYADRNRLFVRHGILCRLRCEAVSGARAQSTAKRVHGLRHLS